MIVRKWTPLAIVFKIFGDWWKEKQEVRRKRKYASNDVQKTVRLKIDLKPKTLGVK